MLGILLEPGKDLSLLGCHEVGHGAEERRGNGLVPIILALPLPGSAQVGGDLARDALFADTITLEGQAQKGDSLFGRWRPGMAELAENRRALELFSLGNVRYEASLRDRAASCGANAETWRSAAGRRSALVAKWPRIPAWQQKVPCESRWQRAGETWPA